MKQKQNPHAAVRLKKFTRKVIRALRSGKYTQVGGTLAQRKASGGYGFCVMGLITHLAGVDESSLAHKGYPYQVAEAQKANEEQRMPDEFYIGTLVGKLVSMNDSGSTFRELADYIEKKVLPSTKKG